MILEKLQEMQKGDRVFFGLDFCPESDYNSYRLNSDNMEAAMKYDPTETLAALNRLYKEMDEIYHLYAKKHNISDSALWLMYSLHESETLHTQREICTEWHYPPQTVNSVLKNLEKQGYIALEPVKGNHKTKVIVLTEKGKDLTEKVISPLIHAECRAIQGLKEEEQKALLSVTKKYADILRTEMTTE